LYDGTNYQCGGENMDGLVTVGIFFAGFFGGLGVFFIGIGILWGISIWARKKKEK
jgi:hypothetical protein